MRDWTEGYFEGYYEEEEVIAFSETMFSNAEISELIYRYTTNDFEE